MLAIFTYGFDLASQRFSESGVALNTLSDYRHLIDQASVSGYIIDEQLETLRAWRARPQEWTF